MRISDWSSDVCSSDLHGLEGTLKDKQAAGACADDAKFADELGDMVELARTPNDRQRHAHAVAHGPGEGEIIAAHHAIPIDGIDDEIGRASCRERVCQNV